LLPLLTCKEAARLGCACHALRGLVRQHYADLGLIHLANLQAALTAFPHARRVALDGHRYSEAEGREMLLQCLTGGKRPGRYLKRVTAYDTHGLAQDAVHEALQQGALPSLTSVTARLLHEPSRASLTQGFLGAVHELKLTIFCITGLERIETQIAALGLVRELPVLAKLDLVVHRGRRFTTDVTFVWPPFIPPSLKSLHIDVRFSKAIMTQSLLPVLPGMLRDSGAKLERFEVVTPLDLTLMGDGLVHVAQALRRCSPTLKAFCLTNPEKALRDLNRGAETHDNADRDERLRVQWADVLAGVSACRELQVLVLPTCIDVELAFPPYTAFDRLTHLEICAYRRGDPSDAGVMGLWELMVSGGLPALAKLCVGLNGQGGGNEEVRTRVAPALEAVADTLTHLYISERAKDDWRRHEVGLGYEWGLAVGRLRRLKDLALDLSYDGRAYHAVAQGLAASGGDRPLPLLWRVGVGTQIRTHADLLASLLLRVFVTSSRVASSTTKRSS
jgi:hypothetical protein